MSSAIVLTRYALITGRRISAACSSIRSSIEVDFDIRSTPPRRPCRRARPQVRSLARETGAHGPVHVRVSDVCAGVFLGNQPPFAAPAAAHSSLGRPPFRRSFARWRLRIGQRCNKASCRGNRLVRTRCLCPPGLLPFTIRARIATHCSRCPSCSRTINIGPAGQRVLGPAGVAPSFVA